jgi:hypothetical protein
MASSAATAPSCEGRIAGAGSAIPSRCADAAIQNNSGGLS